MTWKPVLLATAAAGLLSACAQPQHYGDATWVDTGSTRVFRGPGRTVVITPGARFAAAPRPPHAPMFAIPPVPPVPPIPPLPPLPPKDIDQAIAEARAKGHRVIDRTDNGRRTVIITGPGTNLHYEHDDSPEGRARAAAAADAAREAGRLAREAGERAREAGRRASEEGRRAGERARALALLDRNNVMVLRREDLDRITRDARAMAEEARRQTEAMRPQIDEIRRNAQRLREQCERGEIKCQIIIEEPERR